MGSYVVCMYYNDANSNCSGTVCDTIVIDSNNTSACHASYTYVITGNEVHFTYTGSASVNNQYLWNFGDGTSSTVQNPTHLFSATSTTHTVCLTLFNTNCQDSYCSTFTTGTPPPSYEVHGMVTIGTSLPADVGYVTLYSINPAATPFVTIQTTTIHHDSLGNAFYAFNTVVDGYYLAKASLTPNSQYYLTTLPTYHLSSVDWSTADMINVNGASVTAHINMILGSNTSGNGTITGNVIQGGSKGPGDALADVEIVLLNAGGIAVKHTISAVDGTFSFTNLAYGTYQILAEIAGISCTPYSITLNSSQTSGSSVTVTVNTNNAIINQIEKLDQINIISEVFPNPSSGNSYIDINGKDKVKVNIYNASGVMVSSTEYAINGTKRISLNTQQLPIGVYTVSVENTLKNNVFRKLIISK